MDNSYLFFDIECANCFGGVGKMCSFGYVLVNEDFDILDEDDVVMNPETEFDWYLFDPKKDCQLAYSKDYFRQQHNFESYYSGIKKLMEAAGRHVVGFSVANDIGFLQSACERYNQNDINYAAYDLANILSQIHGKKQSLEDWCEYYKLDLTGLRPHKSVDDAKMTMLLAKAVCDEKKVSLGALLSENKGCKISVEKYLEQRANKRHVDELTAKIKDLYEKKIKCPYTKTFAGQQFAFGFKFNIENVDMALETAETVYKHGGVVHRNLKCNGNLILLDENISEGLSQDFEKKAIKPCTCESIMEKIRK